MFQNMTESDIDKEVEKMLSLDDDEDTRVAILQSQVSVLIEQVKKLSQQAAQSEQPMELDRPATAVALNFRNVMQRVREGDAIPPVELSPFNPADAEQAIGLQTGAAHDHTSDAEQPRYVVNLTSYCTRSECRCNLSGDGTAGSRTILSSTRERVRKLCNLSSYEIWSVRATRQYADSSYVLEIARISKGCNGNFTPSLFRG
ncbi:hypothetical protein GCK32_011552 [Trichostrongylus colubriformis]|uniref:Uncharacterized protein n=1 Tax=Trichostrongylus colubriformis TaxID=6319 RepID=A0AAN8IPW3_TRICO